MCSNATFLISQQLTSVGDPKSKLSNGWDSTAKTNPTDTQEEGDFKRCYTAKCDLKESLPPQYNGPEETAAK